MRKKNHTDYGFYHISTAIDKMERQVCYRTVTDAVTPDDMLKWLIPSDILSQLGEIQRMLTALSACTALGYGFSHYEPRVTKDGLTCRFGVKIEGVNTLPPKDSYAQPQDNEQGERIWKVVTQIADVHKRFMQLRKVVTWFEAFATLAATKMYFPAILALAPSNHALHTLTDRMRYKEPSRPLADIAFDAREAATTIAMGLLVGEAENPHRDVYVVLGHTPTISTMNSQRFYIG